jgi:hypothetical protein
MEALHSSETYESLYKTTRRHMPEDSTLHSHRCENVGRCLNVIYKGKGSHFR